MHGRPLLSVLIALFFGLVAWLAPSFGSVAEAGEGEPPRVYVGVYLHDVTTFELAEGHFDVDLDLWAKWRGEFDPDQLRIANAAHITREPLGVEQDGSWHAARWRVRGTLRGEFPVQRFPMDEQTLSILLELPASAGVLVPDAAGSGVYPRFSITDWVYEAEFRPMIYQKTYPSDLGSLAFEGRPAQLHRVSFDIVLARPLRPVFLKLFLPLGIVGLVVFASLFVGPDVLQPRMTMCVTGLVACFAFQFSISDVLPVVAYLTLADILFICVYFTAASCVATAVAAHELLKSGHPRAATWASRVMRIVVPAVVGVTIWRAVPDPIPPPEPALDALPTVERAVSSVDTLRIGTTQRLRLASLPVGVSAWWGLLHDDPQRGRLSVGVERAPRIDNDAMRFLPDGSIEVTWRIREGLRWSDGTPVTVRDMMLPLEASPDEYVSQMTAVDERTLVLAWSSRLARALAAPELWPAHVAAPVLAELGYEDTRRHLAEQPVPSIGPYRIVHADEDRVVAEANPHFVGTPPAIPRVEVIRYASSEDVVRAFLAREVDVTTPVAFTDAELDAVEAARPGTAHRRPSSQLTLLQPTLAHPLLQQRTVREALLRGIDRGALATRLYGDGGRVAHLPVPGPLEEVVVHYDYDFEGALTALEAHEIGASPLVLTYATTAPSELVDAVETSLTMLGFMVEREEVRSTWPMWREGGQRGLLLHTLRADREQPAQQWWNLAMVEGRFNGRFRNVAYDDAMHGLARRELRALYPERREQLRDALFVHYAERLPGLPLVFGDERILAREDLRGWERPSTLAFGVGLEDWHVSASE